MGTTRVKVIDLASDEQEIKTSRKHAEKLTGATKLKDKKAKEGKQAKADDSKEKTKKAKKEIPSEDVRAEAETTEEKVEKVIEEKIVEEKKETTTKKTQGKKTARHEGKKYQEAKKKIENKPYKLKEALEILPKTSTTSFDPAVEIHMKVADKNIKGNVTYPHQFGSKQKKQKYLIFGEKKEIKADIVWGDEKTINDIEAGAVKPGRDFDLVIASAKFMPMLTKVAKILGPKGMMPNPKNGTITEDFEKAVSGASSGGYSYKSDPMAPIIHAKVGKLSQKSEELSENLKTLTTAIGISKIKKATLTSTMGPAIKLDISSL